MFLPRPLPIVLLWLLLPLFRHTAQAQHNPSSFINLSPSGQDELLYRISTAQARYLLDSNITYNDSSFFSNLLGSAGRKDMAALPYGHYLKVSAQGNQLHYSYIPVSSFLIYLLDNSTDFLLQVKDKTSGRSLPEATVVLDGIRISYDPATGAFRLPKSNNNGLLDIAWDGEHYYYRIDKSTPGPSQRYKRRKLVRHTPIRQIINTGCFIARLPIDGWISARRHYPYGSIATIRHKARQIREGIREKIEERRNSRQFHDYYYEAYTFFSKPKYRLRDTVGLKVLLLHKKKKQWLDVPLYARIVINGRHYFLPADTPSHGSGYSYRFMLHDSMKVKPDQHYYVSLMDKDSTIYVSCGFPVEEYELKKTVFRIEQPGTQHLKGKPYELVFTAKDENGLPMRDARASITVTTANIDAAVPDSLFVPDQLWQYEARIEDGVKKIAVPDSIFPAANISYYIHAVMRNTENERTEQQFAATFYEERFEIKERLTNDSLYLEALQNGSPVPYPVKLSAMDRYGFLLSEQDMMLPSGLPLNNQVSAYRVTGRAASHMVNMSGHQAMIACSGERTADSLFLYISNPRGLPFSYQVYRRDKEVQRGQGSALSLALRTPDREKYYLALQYIWAGRVSSEIYAFTLSDKKVKLTIAQPPVIYPGKETEITITAKDYRNRPLKDISILSYGYTAKFGETGMPALPDLSRKQKNKREINRFTESSDFRYSRSALLNYSYWSRKMQLDTQVSYRFLYPGSVIEKITLPAADNITQVAPFVTDSGRLQPVLYVLLNQVPVYFGFTQSRVPYSFGIDTALRYQQLAIRTPGRLIIIDSFEAKAGCKTLFSLDIAQKTAQVYIRPMPDTFTSWEISNYGRYIIAVNGAPSGSSFSFLESRVQKGIIPVGSGYTTAGPATGTQWNYCSPGNFERSFEMEPYYAYSFGKDLVKMTSSTAAQQLMSGRPAAALPHLGDWVLTREAMMALYSRKPQIDRRSISFPNTYNGTARLYTDIAIPADTGSGLQHFTNILLIRRNDFSFINMYPGDTRTFTNIPPGAYELLLIGADNRYRKAAPIAVRAGGINFIRVREAALLPLAQTQTMDSLLLAMYRMPYEDRQKQVSLIMNEYVQAQYDGPVETIGGQVVDERNEGVPGASVTLKGARLGTITDIDGNFVLDIPLSISADAMLQIASVSYLPAEAKAAPGMRIVLKDDSSKVLESVVIYGSAESKRRQVAAVSVVSAEQMAPQPLTDIALMLEGNAPGISVGNGAPGSSPDILIRGAGTTGAGNPLYVIDGQVYNGSIASIDPAIVASVNMLKDASAVSIYGARGANGVIVITTKAGARLPEHIRQGLEETPPPMSTDLMVSSLRSRFSDEAFWMPDLRTGKDGTVTFRVKFPDDITSWKTFVYATGDHRYTGQASGTIRAYKPISASLLAPRFLVAGDSAALIGKSVNYTPDTIGISTSYYRNDSLVLEAKAALYKYAGDTLWTRGQGDSLKLRYQLSRASDGYFDGEEARIPVVPRGLSVAEGAFLPLDQKDTAFTIPLPASRQDTLYLNATASLLDVVLDEVRQVRSYKHLCNEQLASKILTMLARERLYAALKRPVDPEDRKFVQEMTDRLVQRQNSSGLWGWWQDGRTEYWISRHVLNALMQASEMQYRVGTLNFETIVQPLLYNWEKDTAYADIQSLKLMQVAGLKIDYEKYIARMERKKGQTLGRKLELLHLRQQLGLPCKTELVRASLQEDIFGNIFWKDTAAFIYDNEVQTTLTALEILQADSTIPVPKNKVVNWLLQQRSVQGWRNTYESARIIEVLARAIDLSDTARLKPSLQLSGGLEAQITQFPCSKALVPAAPLQVRKKGIMPVYLTWYHRKWDTSDVHLGQSFTVQSSFIQKGKPAEQLMAGEPAQLQVKVKVPKKAEYVMIEVPIPAGCSYHSKSRGYSGHEMHREYYTDRVSIFCQELPEGAYTYTIELLPRFSGTYTLNPAKAELMYFPVFFGRTAMKRVLIR